MPRPLRELLSPDSAWPLVLDLATRSPFDVDVIPASQERRDGALVALQVTTRSTLGALAANCGAVTIDHGWLRLLGAGAGKLEGLHTEALEDIESGRRFDGIVVAYDILGGRFALHGGGLGEVQLGETVYWGPDTLRWQPTGLGHSALVEFALSDRLTAFYADLRWPGWETDVARLSVDQGFAVYPFLWSREGQGPDLTRRPAPLSELVESAEDAARQLRGVGDGDAVRIDIG